MFITLTTLLIRHKQIKEKLLSIDGTNVKSQSVMNNVMFYYFEPTVENTERYIGQVRVFLNIHLLIWSQDIILYNQFC